jgi:hypothetical protein
MEKDTSGPSSVRGGFPDYTKLERVQDVLDKNKRMLHQVKINHESQRSEGLAKNFQLLREVNENIELVQRIYSQIGEEYVSFMKANSSDVPENLPQSNDGEDQST